MDRPLETRLRDTVGAWAQRPGPPRSFTRLTGDASNRIYVRVAFPAGAERPTAMAMVLPLEPSGSEEFDGAGERPSELPFVTMARWLAERGLPVPAVYHVDPATRVVLLEDLGDVTLEDALAEGGDREALYARAVDLLLRFQARTGDGDDPIVATRPAMDREVLKWELEHYVEWRLEADLGLAPGPWKAALGAAFEPLLDALCALPVRLIHRDFQSRNLMCDERGDYTLIDFQDAMRGPYVYDLVALLRDSYVVLPPALVDRLVARYAAGAAALEPSASDPAEVARHFALQTVQRKLKDTGRFVFIDRVKDNPSFLPFRAPSMSYVHDALARLDELAALRDLVAELDPPGPDA